MKQEYKTISQLVNSGRKYAIIAMNETEYWRDDIKEKADKIECVYLISLKEPTHLCELSISYPAIELRYFFHNTEGFTEDELTEYENVTDQETRYFSASAKVKFIRYYAKHWSEEEVIENEQCNPSYC